LTSSRNFIIVDDKNLATGRGRLSNDKALEKGCILGVHPGGASSLFFYLPNS
jgi:hypothetical protein